MDGILEEDIIEVDEENLIEEEEVRRYAQLPNETLENSEVIAPLDDHFVLSVPKENVNSRIEQDQLSQNIEFSHSSSFDDFVFSLESLRLSGDIVSKISDAPLSAFIQRSLSITTKFTVQNSGIGLLESTDVTYQEPIFMSGLTRDHIFVLNFPEVGVPARPVFSMTEPHPLYVALSSLTHSGTGGADVISDQCHRWWFRK